MKSTLVFDDSDWLALLHSAQKNVSKIGKALTEIALHLKGQAMASAPHLIGDLADSCNIEIRGDEASVFFDKEYAAVRHEDDYELGEASESKQQSAGPGITVGKKYLSRPLHQNRKQYLAAMAEAYKEKIRKTRS